MSMTGFKKQISKANQVLPGCHNIRTSEICGRFLEILRHGSESFAKLRMDFAAKSENLRKRAYVMRQSIFLHFLVNISAILPFYVALL